MRVKSRWTMSRITSSCVLWHNRYRSSLWTDARRSIGRVNRTTNQQWQASQQYHCFTRRLVTDISSLFFTFPLGILVVHTSLEHRLPSIIDYHSLYHRSTRFLFISSPLMFLWLSDLSWLFVLKRNQFEISIQGYHRCFSVEVKCPLFRTL